MLVCVYSTGVHVCTRTCVYVCVHGYLCVEAGWWVYMYVRCAECTHARGGACVYLWLFRLWYIRWSHYYSAVLLAKPTQIGHRFHDCYVRRKLSPQRAKGGIRSCSQLGLITSKLAVNPNRLQWTCKIRSMCTLRSHGMCALLDTLCLDLRGCMSMPHAHV